MPLYMIERAFAQDVDVSGDDVKLIDEINADEGVRWVFSFLSADRRRTYCLYEAPSPEAIIAAARRAGPAPGRLGAAGGRARVRRRRGGHRRAGAVRAPARLGRLRGAVGLTGRAASGSPRRG